MFQRQVAGHGGKAVEIRVAAQVHDLLHVTQGGFQFVILYRLDGGDPMCLYVVGVHIQPQICKLLLCVIGVQRLGNAHGPLNHAQVAGLLCRLHVIDKRDVKSTPLGGYLAGEQQVQFFRLKIGITDVR